MRTGHQGRNTLTFPVPSRCFLFQIGTYRPPRSILAENYGIFARISTACVRACVGSKSTGRGSPKPTVGCVS
eukprot:15891457-Heterocapsa_arctica.AAC.1